MVVVFTDSRVCLKLDVPSARSVRLYDSRVIEPDETGTLERISWYHDN